MHRIFDPYFTTKEKGKGTGLGLAVVHGIVKATRAPSRCRAGSAKGRPSTCYFPMVQAAAAAAQPAPEEAVVGGREHILFVDDEPSIEALGRQMLGSLGYRGDDAGTRPSRPWSCFRSDPSTSIWSSRT